MNWGLESYVRLYTRKTADWMALSWQARAVHALLLREADRAGIIKVAGGPRRIRLLAGLILMPVEVVEVGVPDLLEDGCLVEVAAGYVFPNFIEAQEAKTEAAQRMRDMREKRRAQALLREVLGGQEPPVTLRNTGPGNGPAEPDSEPPEKGGSVTHRNSQLHHVTGGYPREQDVTLYCTVPPSGEEAEAVVVAVGSDSSPGPRRRKTTTTTTKPFSSSGTQLDKKGRAVDEFGFPLRAVDLAQELLDRLEERRRERGVVPSVKLWATDLDAEALELGVGDRFALEWAMEHEHLSLLEALNAEHPELTIRWTEKPRPPVQPPPARWTLQQCLRWMQKRGRLKGGAKRERLEAWWQEASSVPPAALIHAVQEFRADSYWEGEGWPVAKFICEGVWKPRLPPENGAVAVAAQEARR